MEGSAVRFIDADTHVIEPEAAWSHLARDEQRYRPQAVTTDGAQEQWPGFKRFWLFDDQLVPRGLQGSTMPGTPPDDVRSVENPALRLEWMDRFGVEVQVIIPSFFLVALIESPAAQVALARSYNRWMAGQCAASGGRLRWTLVPPYLDQQACLEEIRFGAANGAVGVLMRPIEGRRMVVDPYFFPMYAEIERHNLAVGVHIGNTYLPIYQQPKAVMYSVVPMAAAFVTVYVSDFAQRFPTLRWAFLESGSEWLPYAFREISRGADTAARRDIAVRPTPLAGTNLFVDCTCDEDLPHVLKFAGEDNLVIGSDFGHTDFATDVDAHKRLTARTDVPASVLDKIADTNGRRLYGLDRNLSAARRAA
jgi:predicted TIM-barrel fold metal-dependent hydrolase